MPYMYMVRSETVFGLELCSMTFQEKPPSVIISFHDTKTASPLHKAVVYGVWGLQYYVINC